MREGGRRGRQGARAAGMMPEHSPVPPEACRGLWVDDQRRTVPTSRRGASRAFAFGSFLRLPEMEVAKVEVLRAHTTLL